jgi:hypothetical protein
VLSSFLFLYSLGYLICIASLNCHLHNRDSEVDIFMNLAPILHIHIMLTEEFHFGGFEGASNSTCLICTLVICPKLGPFVSYYTKCLPYLIQPNSVLCSSYPGLLAILSIKQNTLYCKTSAPALPSAWSALFLRLHRGILFFIHFSFQTVLPQSFA